MPKQIVVKDTVGREYVITKTQLREKNRRKGDGWKFFVRLSDVSRIGANQILMDLVDEALTRQCRIDNQWDAFLTTLADNGRTLKIGCANFTGDYRKAILAASQALHKLEAL